MEKKIIYWDKEHLNKINEAIEFDVAPSIKFVNIEISNVIDNLSKNKKTFMFENEKINTLEGFKNFISKYIHNSDYFINKFW